MLNILKIKTEIMYKRLKKEIFWIYSNLVEKNNMHIEYKINLVIENSKLLSKEDIKAKIITNKPIKKFISKILFTANNRKNKKKESFITNINSLYL